LKKNVTCGNFSVSARELLQAQPLMYAENVHHRLGLVEDHLHRQALLVSHRRVVEILSADRESAVGHFLPLLIGRVKAKVISRGRSSAVVEEDHGVA
jgi:hypothetical protein